MRELPLSNREKAELMSQQTSASGMFRVIGLEPVGYWLSKKPERPAWDARPIEPHPEGLLWPGDLIDLSWDVGERAKVVEFLKAGECFMAFCGYSPCRLCDNEFNGTKELICPKKLFVWPEGYAHYVEVHGVKPSQAFINYALGRK